MPDRQQQAADMAGSHGKALQQIGSALNLAPGSNLHADAVRAINALKADNNWLREVVGMMVTITPEGAQRLASLVRESSPKHTLQSLEAEYDELRRECLTPTMESIIQAVHDQAGKGEPGEAIVITIPAEEYDALCSEENAREALIQNGG